MKVKIVHIEGLSAAFMLAPGPGVELVQRIGRKFRLNSQAEEKRDGANEVFRMRQFLENALWRIS